MPAPVTSACRGKTTLPGSANPLINKERVTVTGDARATVTAAVRIVH